MPKPIKWIYSKNAMQQETMRPMKAVYVNGGGGPMPSTQDSRNQTSMSQRNRHRRGKVSLPKIDFD
jgi:hypothetical protein